MPSVGRADGKRLNSAGVIANLGVGSGFGCVDDWDTGGEVTGALPEKGCVQKVSIAQQVH